MADVNSMDEDDHVKEGRKEVAKRKANGKQPETNTALVSQHKKRGFARKGFSPNRGNKLCYACSEKSHIFSQDFICNKGLES